MDNERHNTCSVCGCVVSPAIVIDGSFTLHRADTSVNITARLHSCDRCFEMMGKQLHKGFEFGKRSMEDV